MKVFLSSLFALGIAFSTTAARAQFAVSPLPQAQEYVNAIGTPPIMRLSVFFSAPAPSPTPDMAADNAGMEAARKNLYTQVRRECALLMETYGQSDCRISSINVSSNRLITPNAPPPTLTAIAVYLLSAK